MRKIIKLNGECFPTELSAKGQAAKLAISENGDKEKYIVAKIAEGFIILAPDIEENPTVDQPNNTKSSDEQVNKVQADSGAQQDVAAETTGEEPATKKKSKVTAPWRRSRLLDIPEELKEPGFVYKLANTRKVGRIRELELQGFEVDKKLSAKMKGYERFDKNLDGTYQVNELLVMRISVEGAELRKREYSREANGAQERNEEEVRENLGNGMSLYTPEEGRARAQARRSY